MPKWRRRENKKHYSPPEGLKKGLKSNKRKVVKEKMTERTASVAIS